MIVYLAGPITGVADYRQRFDMAERKLTDLGYTVLNPAILPEGMSKAAYMRICMAMIESADVVAFMPGWQNSAGARIEADYCFYTGRKTYALELVLLGDMETTKKPAAEFKPAGNDEREPGGVK